MSKHHRAAIDMTTMSEGKIELAGLEELMTRIPVD
jgi:hypothetical protein